MGIENLACERYRVMFFERETRDNVDRDTQRCEKIYIYILMWVTIYTSNNKPIKGLTEASSLSIHTNKDG